jgi:hypothetical protein
VVRLREGTEERKRPGARRVMGADVEDGVPQRAGGATIWVGCQRVGGGCGRLVSMGEAGLVEGAEAAARRSRELARDLRRRKRGRWRVGSGPREKGA